VLDRGLAGELHRQVALRAGVARLEPLVGRADGRVVAVDPGHHQRVPAVGRPQRRRTGLPVRRDADDAGLGGQPGRERPPRRGHRRSVHRLAGSRRGDEQRQVGPAGRELLVEHGRRGRRLRAGVLVPPAAQPVGHTAAEHHHADQEQQRGGQHGPRPRREAS
jgi:hypothetical protein